MKQVLLYIFLLFFLISKSQQQYSIHNLSLPAEIADYDNQFSSLYIQDGKLFLLSESRLEDNAEAKLYAISLTDLNRKLKDTSLVLPYIKLPLHNLDKIRAGIDAAGQSYEGLEAMMIDSNAVYFSVETATPSTNCYLLKGALNDTSVVMDTQFVVPLAKPLNRDGSHIYNAGFEAMEKIGKHIITLYEYNYFAAQNEVYVLNPETMKKDSTPLLMPVDKIPFRITDITTIGENHFTAINYFYKGGGGDTVYRTPDTDVVNAQLIRDAEGYKNYCRLVDIYLKDNRFSWSPLWEFPVPYNSYNWEGIAAYKSGYFIINDKYTPSRPYQSTLLYLEKK